MTTATHGARQAETPQYDLIANSYQRARQSPIRRYIELYTFSQLIGDVADKAVLDLACGEGFYSRWIRSQGARSVTGADISPAMIALAREEEAARPMGIDYRVADARALPDLGCFDIVAAAYLLHYSRNADDLRCMCRCIARALKPGGMFAAINENPDQVEAQYRGYSRYGFSKTVAGPRREGSPITYAMANGREMFRFEVYHFARQSYEETLREAGLVDVRWHPLMLDPVAGKPEDDYWQEYLTNPPVLGLTCRLPP